MFDGMVREHRDAVLGRCAERLWPDADAAVGAARDVLIVAYLAMADPAKLARPARLGDWLLAIADHGELASGLSGGIDAIDWGTLQASIAADAADMPDMHGWAARRASLRRWLEQLVATLPEPRQQLYDLFVRAALASRNAATELGIDVAEARRLRRENRDAILRAFEVTVLVAAEAALDPLGDETPGCGQLRRILADAQRAGGMHEDIRPVSGILPADLRSAVTRHVSQCDTCRGWCDDCMAQWAPELLPILAGAELNEQVIQDLRTIPESARCRTGTLADGNHAGRGAHRGPAAGTGKAVTVRRAAVAGAVLLVVLALLGFVQPGFLVSTAASVPRGSSSSWPKDPGSGGQANSDDPQLIGTSAEGPVLPLPSAAKSSPAGLPPIPGVTAAAPASSFPAPAQPGRGTVLPSASPASPASSASSASPSAQPTSAPTLSPSSSPSTRSPSPSASASATQTVPVPSTTPTADPTPTTPPTTPAPTPTPSTSASSTAPQPTSAPSATPPSSPAPSTSAAG